MRTEAGFLDIVMIGSEESWEAQSLGHRPPMLFKAFGQSSRVKKALMIHSPFSLPTRVFRGFWGGKKACVFGPKQLRMNTTAFLPERDHIFSRWDRSLLARRIQKDIKKMGFETDLLWVCSPRITDIAEKIPSKITVFDAMDNLLLHPQLQKHRARIKKGYEWASKNADWIVIASEAQRQMFPENQNIIVLPNGIDETFFSTSKMDCPADMKNIKKPVVMYVGVIQERVDTDLILETARLLPQHSFVMIGPELSPDHTRPLKRQKNVYFLGQKIYSELPGYLRWSDVCMLPHKVDRFTDSMNPMKLLEYLACGKPIVSTPVAGTENFKKFIYLAGNPKSFSESLIRAAEENNPDLISARQKTASLNSWKNRAESALDIFLQKFPIEKEKDS